MRRFVFVLFMLLTATAVAAPQPRQMAQVPMLPLTEGPHPDVEQLLRQHWANYFGAAGPQGFSIEEVRAGRFDIDGDGDPELFLLIDKPAWLSTEGKPLVIATWVNHRWLPIGWGWADDDTVFVTDELVKNWRSVQAGKYLMRWTPKGYMREALPAPFAAQ